MLRRLPFFTCPLLAIALLTSCGEPTKREFAAESGLRERVEAFVTEFETLSVDFPYTAKPFALAAPLPEPLTRLNSLTLSSRELGSPRSGILTTDDNLSLNTNYGMGRTLDSVYASEPIEEGWQDEVEDILSKRYLVLYWTHSYDPPLVVDGKDYYEGGTAKAAVTLYDRESKRYLLAFQVEGRAAGFVEAKAEEWKLKQNLVFEINNLLREDILKKMSAELEKQTGGILYRSSPEEASDSDSVPE